MNYLKPPEVVTALIEAGTRKAALPVRDLLVRGALSGAILGIATSLAITAAVQTSVPMVGALIFPVGFVMIVLLNLELVTGSFAVLPMSQMEGAIGLAATMRNRAWTFVGNLAGRLLYALMLWAALTMFGETPAGPGGDPSLLLFGPQFLRSDSMQVERVLAQVGQRDHGERLLMRRL